MPRMKKSKPTSIPPPDPQSVALNGSTDEVLTLPEAAAYLRLPEGDVIGLVRSQGLPGRFTGGEWRFLKAAIQQWLSASLPTSQTRKEAQLALAGKYKDDPDLIRICEEAYRQRGRPMIEED
jgi:excisionase family DNA binding protein